VHLLHRALWHTAIPRAHVPSPEEYSQHFPSGEQSEVGQEVKRKLKSYIFSTVAHTHTHTKDHTLGN
jgi:hypothetical protein